MSTAARLIDFVHVEPGTILAREGEVARQILLVTYGNVLVRHDGIDEGTAGKGALFGEMAALSHLRYPQTVIALGYTEVAVIGARDFLHLLDSAPPLALKVLERAAGRQRVA